LLSAIRACTSDPGLAWGALEADLARGFLDEAGERHGVTPTPDEQKQRQDSVTQLQQTQPRILQLVSRQRDDAQEKELTDLLEVKARIEKDLADLAVALSRRELASLANVQGTLPSDAAWVAWVDVSDASDGVQEHWGCVVRARSGPVWERLPGSGEGGKWSKEDLDLPNLFREALAKSSPATDISNLAQQLYAQRLAPLEKHLKGVNRLYVVPVRAMAGMPIEALTDQYSITYTPSGTHLVKLQNQKHPGGPAMLLALG